VKSREESAEEAAAKSASTRSSPYLFEKAHGGSVNKTLRRRHRNEMRLSAESIASASRRVNITQLAKYENI